MRVLGAFGLSAGLLLAACSQPVPNSGVGFDDYASYELQRSQGMAAAPTAAFGAPVTVATGPLGAVPPGGIPSTDLAAAGIGVAPIASGPIGTTMPPISAPAPSAVPGAFGAPLPPPVPLPPLAPITDTGPVPSLPPGGLEASPGNAAPPLVGAMTAPPPNDGGISDEQDFDAVASRESIESDAARRAAQAAQYQVVQPTALPPPPQNTGPNIIDYALNAPNAKGQAWYSRFVFSGEGRMQRNCGAYVSADEAQRDFLARGGPERDPRGIDPDGDGFACGWDPAPFLAAVGRG